MSDNSSFQIYDETIDDSDTELLKFGMWYYSIHGYLALFVCTVGLLANTLNIIVLTRKSMHSSTNFILTCLAISDGLVMAVYIPYALFAFIIYGFESTVERNTYPIALFVVIYAVFSVVFHSVSIWLTVALAVFRFIAIRFPLRSAKYCNIQKARIVVTCVVIVVIIFYCPYAANIDIENVYNFDQSNINKNGTMYYVAMKKGTKVQKSLLLTNFWIQAIIIKILPSLLLTLFSILLVSTMRQALRTRRRLLNVTRPETSVTENRRNIRTTRMLLSVIILFVITEAPQGILNIIGSLDINFFLNVYPTLSPVMDILTLINSGINFVLYCSISSQFRQTFINIFLK